MREWVRGRRERRERRMKGIIKEKKVKENVKKK